MRPAWLATDEASKWDVFIHAVENYERLTGQTVELLADMDATAPLKTKEDIEGAIQLAIDNEDADVVITAYEPKSNPYYNMMEIDEHNFARLVKPPADAIAYRQGAPAVYSLSPSAFVMRERALYAYPHWSKARCKLYLMPRERAIDIDTENDLQYVEYLF